MFRFGGIFLVSVYTFMLRIFGFISKYLCRSRSKENGSNFCAEHSHKDNQVVSEKSNVVLYEKESLELQRGEDSCENTAEKEHSLFFQSGWISNTGKYEFVSEKYVSGYIEEPKTVNFMVLESFLGSEQDLVTINLDFEIHPKDSSDKNSEISFEGIDSVEDEILEDQDSCNEVELFPQSQFSAPDVNQESFAAENDILIGKKIESSGKEFLQENDSWESAFLEANDQTQLDDIEEDRDIDHKRVVIKDSELEHLDDECIEFEPLSVNSTDINKENFATIDVFKENKDSRDFDSDDEDESDVLSEHQNLVQQMKMELKNCRTRGLPTISEEYETPKILEDLKPLNIDHKFEYKDVMKEIQKFYKIYSEKMRKLDILNYQTLNAISFLQLKECRVFSTCKKRSVSALLNLSKFWLSKVRKIYADTMQKPITDMHRDLELVYVGQLCLSWEILFWLYVKAQQLMEYDSKGHHSYNRAAEEFQQFQVLVQRFMEDEQFQGPRILSYVKNRCMARGLLQVPTIKDDCLKDNKERREEEDMISVELLVEIIKESMLIFWEFLRAEKGIQGTKVDLEEMADSVILVEIIKNLQKMDRRVREQVRSQKCMAKKFQKHQERGLDHELLASQVELRLVTRVLNLSRLTKDQLIWCQKKLSNISYVRRRVHVEPSFLLFPC